MNNRRAAILLEIMLALALFVTTSLTLLSIISQSTSGLTRSRDRLIAADHARSAMSQIEAGIARPETLNGPIQPAPAQLGEELDPGFIGIDPDDAPSGEQDADPTWALEIETDRSEYDGLTLVRVRAHRIDPDGFEPEGAATYTLSQFVRLAGTPQATEGAQPAAGPAALPASAGFGMGGTP